MANNNQQTNLHKTRYEIIKVEIEIEDIREKKKESARKMDEISDRLNRLKAAI